MKILLVEDDEVIAQHVSWGLGQEGFDVTRADDGIRGLDLVYETQFRLIILDLMLPKLSGLAFIKLLRDEANHTPILILSALDQVEHRVKGLEVGADDYLVKPFSVAELSARVRAILRRGGATGDSRLTCHDLEVDTRRVTVTRGKQPIDLSPREYSLLLLLLEMKGQVLSRSQILERVWDIEYAGDGNVIDVGIRRLRAKIDDDFDRKLIHTVRGRGYALR